MQTQWHGTSNGRQILNSCIGQRCISFLTSSFGDDGAEFIVLHSGSDSNIISIIYIKTGKSGKYSGGNNDTSFCRDTDGNDSGVVMMIILESNDVS